MNGLKLTKKLVIDTDGVVDDVRAISLALQTPDVEVLAITCVSGGANVEQSVANVSRTLRMNDAKVPIYKGAEKSLIGKDHSETYFFGNDGLGDVPDCFPKAIPEDFKAYERGKHASLALIDIFNLNPDATLVCIGPLTNVALALRLEPKFADMPANLVILGGNIYGMGNTHSYSTAEFNFYSDPESAHIVLNEMRCPIKLIPWESFIFEAERSSIDFHAHLYIDAPLAQYFNAITMIGRKQLERAKKQYAYCDEVAIAVAIDHDRIVKEAKFLRVTVELHGEVTRGQMAVDWMSQIFHEEEKHPSLCKKRREIEVITKYDVFLLDKMIFDAIESHKCPGTGTME